MSTFSTQAAQAVIVMGVSGTGKSTIGKALGEHLSLPFFDGDDFHSKANVEKMASGQSLNDADRAGWLECLCSLMRKQNAIGIVPVIACSALKTTYRDKLRTGAPQVFFLFLEGSRELLMERMERRAAETGHFMKANMLDSQLSTLESPLGEAGVLTLDVIGTPGALLNEAVQFLKPKIIQ